MVTPVAMEPLLGYHPCSIGFLTSRRDPAVGQCQTGSLTGAVASERVSEAPKGSLRMDGNHSKSARVVSQQRLHGNWRYHFSASHLSCTCNTESQYQAGVKLHGDNRLITPKSSHRRSGLAPRCRLIASWGCSRSQGLGCSPIKAVRELGSERRETVRSLSGAGGGYLRGAVLSTRGPGWTDHWCICCRPTAWQSSQVWKG